MMARQVAPGNPPEITAKQYNVDTPDWSVFEKLGDAKIKAANNNFKLYAEALIGGESAKLYNQYKNDPVNLANALGKLPEMLKDLPQEIQDEMNKKLYLNGVALVQKAQNNQVLLEDAQNKNYANYGIVSSKDGMLATYGNVLQNHISKAEDKSPVMNDIFLQQVDNLHKLSELKNSKGLDVYTPTQKKAIRNIADVELEAFKQFVDNMIINDDDKLTKTTEYYQKYVLAPERFMAENYMDRTTYEKARQYLAKTMKDAGVKTQGIKFQQSIKEATELQVADLPGKLESLREAGQIDKKIIDQIEKTNVKFNDINPSKAELPTAMLDMLDIVNSWENLPENASDEQKMLVLAEGTAALDAIADLATKYGWTPESVKRARQSVALKEQNVLYGETLNNFGAITQSFGSEIPDMEKKMNYIRAMATGGRITGKDFVKPTRQETQKLTRLNDVLAVANDMSREAIRAGDIQAYNQIQSNLRKQVAQIKYSGIIKDYMWAEYEKNPDYPFVLDDGTVFQIVSFAPNGDIATK